jgi:hypothetical protein
VTLASILLGLLPALVLAAALIAGRYPGERILSRLRPRGHRRPAGGRRPCAASFVRSVSRRSGELLSRALAGRPPPPCPA